MLQLENGYHSDVLDPSFAGLASVLEQYGPYEVLRYRPGKRITIGAVDPTNGAVIVKYITRGARDVFDRLYAVSRVRKQLGFDVSRPLQFVSCSKCFSQERLGGAPIDIKSAVFAKTLVYAMADAIRTLHESSASFEVEFDARSQSARSDRYFKLIKSRFPDTEGDVNRLCEKLRRLEQHIYRKGAPLVPIHGSLHSHQWLHDDGRLALVDFDRAAMGHAELDLATFLAEFDYESETIGSIVNHAFLSRFNDHDPDTLLFYRAHKHIAKAFKASKNSQPDIALTKTRRNLDRTTRLLAGSGFGAL